MKYLIPLLFILSSCASTINEDGTETPAWGYRMLHKTKIWKLLKEDG